MIKRCVIVVILGLLLSVNGTAMVAIFVVEKGLTDNRMEHPHSIQWENAFLDVFFEAGYIVTNAPISRIDSIPQDYLLESLAFEPDRARMMGIEFILITILDFNGETNFPEEIYLYIYSVSIGNRIFERQIPGRTYRTSREELDDLKAIARGLLPHIIN
jgi:hypothetical protein